TQKRAYFAWRWSANYDVDLRRIFCDASDKPDAPLATRFLRRRRPQLRNRIAEGTGVHAYTVDQLLRQMIARLQSLGLRVADPPEIATEKLLVSLTMQIATVIHSGYPKVALRILPRPRPISYACSSSRIRGWFRIGLGLSSRDGKRNSRKP